MLQLMTANLLVLGILFSNYASAQVVAVVGNEKISLEEFNKKYQEVKEQSINPPSKELFLEDLIRYKIGVQEAEKRKLDEDPAVKERFKQELYKALIEKEIGNDVQKITVSEAEMKAFYQKNPEFRSSHILIEFKQDANDKEKAIAKKRAQDIYKEVQASKRPFEELVKLYSDDSLSKTNGGDINYQSRSTLVPSYYNALASMKVNEIKGLVETPYGFHIVKLTGKRSYEQSNKRQLRAAVFDEKRKDLFNAFFKKLRSKYKVSINKNAISSVK